MKLSLACLTLLLVSCGDSGDASTTSDARPGSVSVDAQPGSQTLSERYPGDLGIADDPAVLFSDDFESGWGRWDGPSDDTEFLTIDTNSGIANGGDKFLRSTVTFDDLNNQEYISSSTRVTLDGRHDEAYWRFYTRFPNVAPNPHHWVRMAAGSADYNSSGLANTVPSGDDGFWFDLDATNDDDFMFYAYWHEMRSGNCNNGTTTPGCEGDQGHSNHYGNVFRPSEQQPFVRDEWLCIEIHATANTVGAANGALAFYVNGALVGDYRPSVPDGTWLRETFHTDGCEFSACEAPAPFEGFDFRSSADVGIKSFFLDAYYERETSNRKRTVLEERGLTVSEEQTILYDDVVVATERIGCKR